MCLPDQSATSTSCFGTTCPNYRGSIVSRHLCASRQSSGRVLLPNGPEPPNGTEFRRPVAVWFQALAPLSEPLLLKSSAVVISDGDRSRRLCLRSEFHPANRNRRKERLYVACQRLPRRRGKAPIGRHEVGRASCRERGSP